MTSSINYAFYFLFSILFSNEMVFHNCDPDYCSAEYLKTQYDYIYDSQSDALYYLDKYIKNELPDDYERARGINWTVATKPPKNTNGKDCKESYHANIGVLNEEGQKLNQTIALLKVRACENGNLTWVYAFVDNKNWD